jgi:hypothetical protein
MVMINSAEEFYKLRTSEFREEYERAAHEEAPVEVWLDVIGKFPEMRSWVAQNKTVPIEVLEVLSRDRDADVRSFVAMRRKLPERIQLALARDEDYSVRERLVLNAKVTDAVLQVLVDDAELRIREKAKERLAQVEWRDAAQQRHAADRE